MSERSGGPRGKKVGALLAVSAQGPALGTRWAEGAFHLPRVHVYKASGFVPQPGHFFLLSGTFFLIGRYLIALPQSVGRREDVIHRLGSGAEGNHIG